MAGFGQPDALSLFLSLKLGTALACGTAAALWATGNEAVAEHVFLVALAGLAGLVIGSVIPEYVLRALAARRTHRMSTALPDALDLTVMCLESGLTFERAMVTVAEELKPIEPSLADELRMMEAELRVSSDRRMVLQEFHHRTEIEGLRDLAMTLIQSERYGTPLTQSMKNIAASERAQRALRIAARAERLPVLLTLPMLLFVVPGTMALVAGPAFLTAIQALRSLGGRNAGTASISDSGPDARAAEPLPARPGDARRPARAPRRRVRPVRTRHPRRRAHQADSRAGGGECREGGLGRDLFHDPRLSRDDTVSCASCHVLSGGGDDGRKVSIGIEGQPGRINSPTVFNAGLNFKQFWDGRVTTLEQQIDDPVQSPLEMGSLWPDVVAKLYRDGDYPGRFTALYPDGISRNSIRNALAEFMRSLTTPNSRFDRWLKGDASALSAQEKHGYALFKHYGCALLPPGSERGRQHVPGLRGHQRLLQEAGRHRRGRPRPIQRHREPRGSARVQGPQPAHGRPHRTVPARRQRGDAARRGRRDVRVPVGARSPR